MLSTSFDLERERRRRRKRGTGLRRATKSLRPKAASTSRNFLRHLAVPRRQPIRSERRRQKSGSLGTALSWTSPLSSWWGDSLALDESLTEEEATALNVTTSAATAVDAGNSRRVGDSERMVLRRHLQPLFQVRPQRQWHSRHL